MYSENELLPISGLQHLLFCERRCALVLIEGAWSDNIFTAEGHILHERVHGAEAESRRDIRMVRGLRLHSLRLGLAGVADLVEFHRAAETEDDKPGLWRAFPVEYKRGRLRREEGYEVQLCAQAMCLEEMLGAAVPAGAIYFGQPRKRLEVEFDAALRVRTEAAAARMHELVRSGKTPLARYEKKCDSCSLYSVCLPKTLGRRGVGEYLAGALDTVTSESGA